MKPLSPGPATEMGATAEHALPQPSHDLLNGAAGGSHADPAQPASAAAAKAPGQQPHSTPRQGFFSSMADYREALKDLFSVRKNIHKSATEAIIAHTGSALVGLQTTCVEDELDVSQLRSPQTSFIVLQRSGKSFNTRPKGFLPSVEPDVLSPAGRGLQRSKKSFIGNRGALTGDGSEGAAFMLGFQNRLDLSEPSSRSRQASTSGVDGNPGSDEPLQRGQQQEQNGAEGAIAPPPLQRHSSFLEAPTDQSNQPSSLPGISNRRRSTLTDVSAQHSPGMPSRATSSLPALALRAPDPNAPAPAPDLASGLHRAPSKKKSFSEAQLRLQQRPSQTALQATDGTGAGGSFSSNSRPDIPRTLSHSRSALESTQSTLAQLRRSPSPSPLPPGLEDFADWVTGRSREEMAALRAKALGGSSMSGPHSFMSGGGMGGMGGYGGGHEGRRPMLKQLGAEPGAPAALSAVARQLAQVKEATGDSLEKMQDVHFRREAARKAAQQVPALEADEWRPSYKGQRSPKTHL